MIAYLLCTVIVLQLQVCANAARIEAGTTDAVVGLALLAEVGLVIWGIVLLATGAGYAT